MNLYHKRIGFIIHGHFVMRNSHKLGINTLKVLLLFCIFLCAAVFQAHGQAKTEEPQIRHFQEMADYLSRGSGKWTGENKSYAPDNPKSPRAFGLWFDRPMNNLLTIKIVAYLKDTTIISSQGIFSWHPIKRQFVHVTVDRGDGFSEGISEFPNDSTFISTMTIYRPSGKFYDHKDENFIVNENLHRNISFSKDEHGQWIEKSKWTWRRDQEE